MSELGIAEDSPSLEISKSDILIIDSVFLSVSTCDNCVFNEPLRRSKEKKQNKTENKTRENKTEITAKKQKPLLPRSW